MDNSILEQKRKLRDLNLARIAELEEQITDLTNQLIIHEEEGTKMSFELSKLKEKTN